MAGLSTSAQSLYLHGSIDHHQSVGLWGQIRAWLQPQEVEEVKHAIGAKIIEKNESLHGEISALSDIVDNFREETTSIAVATQGKSQEKRELLLGGAERSLLEDQIRLLLLSLHPVDRGPSDREHKICKYLAHGASGGSVPTTGRRPSTANSGLNSTRSAPDTLEHLSGKLNAYEVDGVLSELRELFADEERALLQEVEALMGMFDQEEEDRRRIKNEAKDAVQVPSTSELREFGAQLQQEALAAEVTGRADHLLNSVPHGGRFARGPLTLDPLWPSSMDLSCASGNQKPPVPRLPLSRGEVYAGGPKTAKPNRASRLSSRIRGEVQAASEASRNDFHLSDERFLM